MLNDIVFLARSDDNRRKLPLAVLMAHCQWLMDLELSHDIICISRSDDNRRKLPLAVLMAHCQWLMSHDIICISRSDDNRQKLPLAVLMVHCQWPMDLVLSHDILCISRSDDNRRSCRSLLDVFHHIYSLHDFIFSTKATATAAISFRVFRGSKNQKNSC